ncbi:hypothetical protein [Brevundimonas sp.]|uniref:hypothetical protein n=1 Tax=Brevundimonas sp. TaxID=1871086 RepID=UPI002FDAD542
MIRRLLLTAVVVSLTACNAPEPAQPVPGTPSGEQSAPTVPAGDRLTANGFGPLRIGMTKAEVEAALGLDSDPNSVGGPDPASCDMFRPTRAPEGLLVMLEGGVLTSIWATRNAVLETDRGLNIGDSADEVRRVYGPVVVSEPHKYVEAPAEYLTIWSTTDHASPAARGVKYEIDSDGRVQSIAVGGPSIEYVEGCA